MGTNRNKGNIKRQPSPTASRDTKASKKGQQSTKDTPRSEESSDVELQNILLNRQQCKQKQVPQTEKQQDDQPLSQDLQIIMQAQTNTPMRMKIPKIFQN